MNYYTSPTASVTVGNSPQYPTTLMDACSKAGAGDTIYLTAGTYRGTYRPQSGVSLVGIDSPTISGLDVVSTAFTKVGTYYTTPATSLKPLDRSMGADQVLVDGVEVMESRWPLATPSTRGAISSWAEATAVSIASNNPKYVVTYTVPGLPKGGTLTDCQAHVLNGHQWISIGAEVISSTESTVTLRFSTDKEDWNVPKVGSRLYLWGGATLPHGFRIAGGLLYLAEDPGTKAVEVKVRHWGLDLCGVRGVTIEGINFQCCSIHTNDSTVEVILESISMEHISHFQAPTAYWWGPPGIRLRDGSKVTNSTFTTTAGGVLELRGDGCEVDNVTITDITYSGCCQVGISLQGNNHKVSRCTLGRGGSSGLLDTRNATNCTIRGCEVYGGGGILTDGGSVMFADSHVTADQGNKLVESYIHDTRGRTGTNLYGNAGVYVEQRASATIRDCYIRGATSNDLQVVPLDTEPGSVLVERCTVGTLSISYTGSSSNIPIIYRDNIVGTVRGSLRPATVVGNAIDNHRLAGNTQAPGVLSTLDGSYPGPYSPPGCGARCTPFYWGSYTTTLDYKASIIKADGDVRVRLEGRPPPDGFTVKCGATTGIVRQYDGYLIATFPVSIGTGKVSMLLSAPARKPRRLRVFIPPNKPADPSQVMMTQVSPNLVTVIATITSNEESWDIPVPVPVGHYITQGLMKSDGTGIRVREGLPLYVDPTYPIGGVHAWVRVPRIPVGESKFTLILGGSDNVSSAKDTFIESEFHLRQGDGWNKEECEGISVTVEGGELVIRGKTTIASKFGGAGIRAKSSYPYPSRSFSWDSYVSMAPNTAGYWWAGLGNNAFLLTNAGAVVNGKPSTMGIHFTRRLVSNLQLPTSYVWQEDMVTLNTRGEMPIAKGIFSILPAQEGKAIEWKYHYIRARGVPDSGVMPTITTTTVK